ncbi:MAG: efflux RND transporter periplasmic adaptor subunit, partial [Hyphomicrobiales bacterium]|nr:efflux RND transporter periplasmic adaptor subunit [Hyphomicrobiales bacterium]
MGWIGGGAGVQHAQQQASGAPAGDARRSGGPGAGPGGGPPAVGVTVAESRTGDMPVTLDAIGTAQALNTVTVRTQVDGRLMQLLFAEGQDVKTGDVLAIIDPTVYQAAYDQAVAKKAQDEAQLANAKLDLVRYSKLAVGNYGTKQQADTQRALVAQLTAQVKQDQAAIDNTKAQLGYTTIRSPIDGRTGIRLVDRGNILHASDQTGIVVITQIKPTAVIFSIAQQNLAAVNAAMARGPVSVQALAQDNATVIGLGKLEVIDNQVDATTGTAKAKAIFPNDDRSLWAGAFVNVRILVDTLKNVVIAPTAAVQRGPSGAFVYVIGDDNVAHQTSVQVGQQNEREAVIASGLAPPARVAISGFARLTDGAKVRIVQGETPQAAPGAAAPQNNDARPAGEGA